MTRWVTNFGKHKLFWSGGMPAVFSLGAGIALSLIGQGSVAAQHEAKTLPATSPAIASDVSGQVEPRYSADETDYGDDGDLIVQLYLRDILLGDALFCRVIDNKVYLPLSELADLLDFPIIVDGATGKAAGWFIEPARKFKLDIEAAAVETGDRSIAIPPDAAFIEDEDIYAEVEALGAWFPLKFDLNIRQQRLVIRSVESLPMELARDRQKHKVSKEQVFAARLPFDIPSYRLLDWPAVAVDMGGFFSQQTGSGSYDYSVRAVGDLAFMNGRFAASGDSRGIDSVRLAVGRHNPTGMLGPLGIADFEVGDTSQFLPALIGNSLSGRGLRFGNSRLNTRRDFDNIDLQGLLLSGYEVELYANDRLIGVHRDSSDGLYRFEDVPLKTGQNVLRLEFYGPQGQRQTEIRRSFVGTEQNRRGEFFYEFALLQPGRLVFEDINGLRSGAVPGSSGEQVSGSANFSIGLTRRATLGITVASLAADPDLESLASLPEPADSTLPNSADGILINNLTYLNARLNTDLFGLLVSYDLTMDDNAELAGALRMRTRVNKLELSASQIIYGTNYRRFNDRNSTDPDTLPRTQSNAGVTRSYQRGPFNGSVSWGTNLNYATSQNSSRQAAATARLDYIKKALGVSWSHSYNRNLDAGSTTSTGQAGLSIRADGNWSYRAGLNYSDGNKEVLQGASVGIYRSLRGDGSIALQASRDAVSDTTAYSATWNQTRNHYRFSSSIAGSSKEDITLRIGVAFSAQRSPGSVFPQFSGRDNIGQSRLAAHVYVDENSNQQYDKGEEAVSDVRLTRNGLPSEAVTNSDGYATLTGLPPSASTDVALNIPDIDDPTLKSQPLIRGVLSRPGRLPIVNIPLVRTADLEGTVTIDGAPAPNVRILLKGGSDGETLEARTEFDGVYYLSGIPVGRYELAPDSEQLSEIDLYAPESTIFEVTKDDSVLYHSFALRRGAKILVSDVSYFEEPAIAAAYSVNGRNEGSLETNSRDVTGAAGVFDSIPEPEVTVVTRSPDGDIDKDGVRNSVDRCYGTRRSDSVNRFGCVNIGGHLKGANFAAGSAVVTTDIAFILNGLARELNANPSMKVVVETHTDNEGAALDNMNLSMERARSIIRYLINTGKVSGYRLSGVGMGESSPAVSNRSRAGRKANRRIVVRFSK